MGKIIFFLKHGTKKLNASIGGKDIGGSSFSRRTQGSGIGHSMVSAQRQCDSVGFGGLCRQSMANTRRRNIENADRAGSRSAASSETSRPGSVASDGHQCFVNRWFGQSRYYLERRNWRGSSSNKFTSRCRLFRLLELGRFEARHDVQGQKNSDPQSSIWRSSGRGCCP